MLSVSSRKELDTLAAPKRQERASEPLAPPPPPAELSPALERALALLTNQVAIAAEIAATAQASIAEFADRKDFEMRGDIVRDQQGKMTSVTITIRK